MKKLKLLIAGDSFAADLSNNYSNRGWPNLLSNDFNVTNIAQPGCSEFKIYQQITSVNLKNFDQIVIAHTSPYRIFTKENPIHQNDPIYRNSCFIYSDVKDHDFSPIKEFYEMYFDVEYAKYIHGLILKDIEKICPNHTIHITSFDYSGIYTPKNYLNFEEIFQKHKGTINHYNECGNDIVYKTLLEQLRKNY